MAHDATQCLRMLCKVEGGVFCTLVPSHSNGSRLQQKAVCERAQVYIIPAQILCMVGWMAAKWPKVPPLARQS